ncbi:MAG: bifunctional phosphoribosylaminoimidazolecarboxamide formyltransferase/IMP cyclohydrolase [Tannerellaceae bacterium]|jgi:phosphoribosylaminoimidazolecarboxamide formyltransferase/IMP cyclohydrolase|nr:bifunctional phosphoribosylaminoimidazolecarboxamide formyltransferase/IMP cyclohydrolase [Tannerellaceae bacterium]
MVDMKPVKRALISVYDKDGLDGLLKSLHASGVAFVSTGGTQAFIESSGFPCAAVEDLTGYPSILGGRVKTLHPKVFGGILSRRKEAEDAAQLSQYGIEEFDLVIVDLYPFEQTVASGAPAEEIIEKIDIGGISLIRAAAKNFEDVLVVASKAQYGLLGDILARHGGAASTLAERRMLAREAFAVTSGYDTHIYHYFDGLSDEVQGGYFRAAVDHPLPLRYGENPHQKAQFYGDLAKTFSQLHGKEVSYNNMLDIEAALSLISEFEDLTFAVIKHNNACGIASRPTVEEAWTAALACDPVSAFGGILITNATVTAQAAESIHAVFFEIILAPAYEEEALTILKEKKNRIILVYTPHTADSPIHYRTLLNGVLTQERDSSIQTAADLQPLTVRHPDGRETEDLLFANKVVKNSKSNAITLVKNKQLCASGVGQTSRVDALRQAIEKAKSFGFDLQGAVMASDAFFPFPDCVDIAAEAGITAVIQPGGSIKDSLSVESCNKNGLAMVKTGIRHFKH